MPADAKELQEWALIGIEQQIGFLSKEIEGLQAKKETLQKSLRQLRGEKEPQTRMLSDEARKRISEAQKKRWAAKRERRGPGRPPKKKNGA